MAACVGGQEREKDGRRADWEHKLPSAGFVADRSCNSKRGSPGKLATLGPICSVFEELCDNEHCVFGNGLSKEQAKVLAALAKPVHLEKGQVLFTEGKKISEFIIVISGQLSEEVFTSVSRIRPRGSVLGEVGLLDGLEKAVARVMALEDSMVAAIPFRKFLSFLERDGEELTTRVLQFVKRELFPELMAIEGTRMRNASSTCIQCAMRSCLARRAVIARRNYLHRRAGRTIRRYFKVYLVRLKIWRELRKPLGRRLQCAIRMMLARRKVARQRQIRDMNSWYGARESEVVAVQRLCREKMAAAADREKRLFEDRRMQKRVTMSTMNPGAYYDSDSPLRTISPDSEPSGSVLSSPLGAATRQLIDLSGNSDDELEINQSDMAALRKWILRDMHKCFTAWNRYLKSQQKQRHKMRGIIKSMKHLCYHSFKKWKTKSQNVSTIVTPWRSHEGQKVQLREEGKEHEFALGRRIDGDDGTGYLVSPMLKDKTVWNVRWEASGLMGAYYTGSCGRYFLNWVDKKKTKKKPKTRQSVVALIHALQDMRLAFDDDRSQQGLRTTMTVTPPFGAKMGLSCPPGTDWRLEVEFVPKSVSGNISVTVKALEASEFGCSRNDLGIVVSPVVQVRHRTWNPFSKPFTLRIPHRCSSSSKLYLYHWPGDFAHGNKVPGAEFTDEVCTAEVTGFGLYAVVNSDPLAPDVVYGQLDVGKRWRDNIGKMVTRMSLGKTHPGSVTLIPRGCAEPFEGASALLPKFNLRNGTLIEKVDAIPDIKLEGCMINCWSGRVKYRGGLTSVDFNVIIQTIPTEPLPFTMPLFDCSIVLKNAKDHPVVAFDNGNYVRMKVTTVQLCVEVEMKPPLSSVHYECMLQGRENLRDIRIWVAKCFAGARIEDEDLEFFSLLRFEGPDNEMIPLNIEALEPASNHLPKIKMSKVPEDRAGAETPQDAVTRMSFALIEKTAFVKREIELDYIALPSSAPKAHRSADSVGMQQRTPFVGYPHALELRERSVLSRPTTCVSRELVLSSSYPRALSERNFSGQLSSASAPGTGDHVLDDKSVRLKSVQASRSLQGHRPDTSRPSVSSSCPRILQVIIGSPRTPRRIDVSTLERFNRTLDKYGCATPRNHLPDRQTMSRLRFLDPEKHARMQELKSQQPLLTKLSQSNLEHRRNVELVKLEESVGRVFPYPPGSRADDTHAFVRDFLAKNKGMFTGPKSPTTLRQNKRRDTDIFNLKQLATGDETPETPCSKVQSPSMAR